MKFVCNSVFLLPNYDTGSTSDKLLTLEYMILVHIDIYKSEGISFNMLDNNLFICLLNAQSL